MIELNQVIGTTDDDVLNGTNGEDRIVGSGGNDVLRGKKGDDILLGGQGDDLLFGGNGKDILRGGLGSDTLRGGNGDDLLIGGAGGDIMVGGRGADRFLTRSNHMDAENFDTIEDFEQGTDILILEGYGCGSTYSQSGQYVSFDIDGDGSVDHVIRFKNGITLGSGDISGASQGCYGEF